MTKPYTRKLSFMSERYYLAANQLHPAYANQVVIEGSGCLDKPRWQSAVEKASAANPGSRVVLKGCPGFRRWEDSGETPRVREVDGSKWSGFSSENAPFLKEPLLPSTSPTCEVLLVHGNPLRVVFRSLHAVMDGRGTGFWAEEIFRALRGEPLVGSDSSLTDYELMRSFQTKTRKPFPREYITPTGKAIGQETGFVWRRKKIQGHFSKLLPQVAILMAKEAWRHSDGKVLLAVPVDLRSRKEGLCSTANLTGFVLLTVKPETTSDQITEEISQQLNDRCDGMIPDGISRVNYSPLWRMRITMRKIVANLHASGHYFDTGIISNLGRLPVENYIGGEFQATTGFFIPPAYAYSPAFMSLSGTGDGIEMLVTMPGVLANQDRIDTFLDHIAAGLVPK